jgi:hypothetical protein
MSNTAIKFVIKHTAGQGFLRRNFLTSFPLVPANWVQQSNRKFDALVKQYDDFADASTDVQCYFSSPRGSVEIVQMPK